MAKNTNQAKSSKIKVLYQNLNGIWYAFAQLGDNVFFGKVPLQASSSDIEKLEEDILKKLKTRKSSGRAA